MHSGAHTDGGEARDGGAELAPAADRTDHAGAAATTSADDDTPPKRRYDDRTRRSPPPRSPLLSTQDAAGYIHRSPSYLRHARSSKASKARLGPAFIKMGKDVFYLIEDLDAWLRSRRKDPAEPKPSAAASEDARPRRVKPRRSRPKNKNGLARR
jgi:hypothetical protein